MGTNPAEMPSSEHFSRIYQLVGGHRVAQAIYVVVELGIPDLLSSGPVNCRELAAKSGAHSPTLNRLLRFLSGAGLFDEVDHEVFVLTALGATLKTGAPGSPSTIVRMLLREFHWRPWSNLIHTVRTGETAFDHTHGMGVFDYLRTHPDDSEIFNAAMTASSTRSGTGVAEHYDFTGVHTVVDVGGGHGFLLATILNLNPGVQGVLFDLPDVVAGAAPVVASYMDRCKIIGGSFFDELPQGNDIYILRQIVHDWDDDRAEMILRNCRAAMTRPSKLLLVERRVDPDHREAMRVLQVDMEMLVNVGGMERTDSQYRSLLNRAGFEMTRIIPLMDSAGFSVFEGVPSR